VLGQPSFTTSLYNADVTDAKSFRGAFVLALDSHQSVWVVDYGCSRVLEFDDPKRFDTTADRVFGQPDFASNTANTGGISARTLSRPLGIVSDPAGNLAVADSDNNRVVLLETPTPIVSSLQVKVARAGRPRLLVSVQPEESPHL
jgi:DNA-binding beta-propeller fold protein YncE